MLTTSVPFFIRWTMATVHVNVNNEAHRKQLTQNRMCSNNLAVETSCIEFDLVILLAKITQKQCPND